MLRTYFKIAIATAAAFVFASCNNDSPVVEDNVQVNGETELVFTQEDTADKTVTFSANTDWTVSYEAAWLEVTPTSGVAAEEIVLTVSLKEVEAPVKRSDVVVITAGTAKAEVTVIQEATVVKDNVQVNGETELVFTQEDTADKTVTFSANTNWTVASEAEWFTVTPATGTAGENLALTVSLNEAETAVERTENVVIAAGDATASFSVTQKATVYAESFAVQGNHRVVVDYTTPLTVVPTPANGKLAAVTYVSSNPEFATVDENGVVTAVAVGEATITVTAGELVQEFWVEVTETFMTDGIGKTYTFADLAAIEYSGVQGAAGEYVITANVTVAETDVIALGDAKKVVFNDAVTLSVDGLVDFVATEEVAFAAAEGATPKPIYFTGDVESGGSFKNIAFNAVTIRYYGVADVNVENCLFTGVTASEPCVNLGGDGLVTVSNCKFIENAYPAVSGAANLQTPIIVQDCYLYKNSQTARNKPQINLTPGGDGVCKVLRNTIIGPAEVTMNGGICVSNMMSLGGTNNVEIIGNKVSDNRYGIAIYGQVNATISDNVLMNNKYESNPMNGGSGVSLYGMGTQKIYMSGNHIEGHYWGITNIFYTANPILNLGNLTEGENYNPGGNVFVDNGNGGALYDLYNNSTGDVMAQGNTWNVDVQDEASIEEVIYHKVDQSNLGLVTFMPAASAE